MEQRKRHQTSTRFLAVATRPVRTEDQELGRVLEVLSHPVRITILKALRVPTRLRSLLVSRSGPEADRSTPLARQTVHEHLRRLLEAGLVRRVEEPSSHGVAYVVNHQALFALSEELLELAKLRPSVEVEGATEVLRRKGVPPRWTDPSLVEVRGPHEGRSWPLAVRPSEPQTWEIGRSRTTDICLDHDPYVSALQGTLAWDGSGFQLASAETSSNPPLVNFQPLLPGEVLPIHAGDLISLGRTNLLLVLPA